MSDKKRELVKQAAEILVATNSVTTTLQIKKYLRVTEPSMTWNQDYISSVMDALHLKNEIIGLIFHDNGQFREYTIDNTLISAKKPKKVKAVKVVLADKKISRTAMVDLIKETKGGFFTVAFYKTDGSKRVLNGNVKLSNFMDNLGYINVRESNGNIRRINPKTLISLKTKGQLYKI